MQSFFMRIMRTLIRPRGCASWFDSSLGAHVERCVFWPCGSFDYVSLPKGRGHSFLMWRWVGVGVTLSCLHNILWTSGWILIKFSWIYNWVITKNWLDFIELGLIFKITTVEKLKILRDFFVCAISYEPVVWVLLNVWGYTYIIRTWQTTDYVLVALV